MRRITLYCLSLIMLGVRGKSETPQRIFERVSPSVVVVEVSDAAGKPVAQGSGVVIGAGVVITNCHVAEDGARLLVTHLGKTFAATLQYADTDRDLCQLSVPKLSAPAVALGDANSLKVGQSVYAIGAPLVAHVKGDVCDAQPKVETPLGRCIRGRSDVSCRSGPSRYGKFKESRWSKLTKAPDEKRPSPKGHRPPRCSG